MRARRVADTLLCVRPRSLNSNPCPSPPRRLRAVAYMLLMLVASFVLTIMEVLAYPIVKLRDPVLFTYHQ